MLAQKQNLNDGPFSNFNQKLPRQLLLYTDIYPSAKLSMQSFQPRGRVLHSLWLKKMPSPYSFELASYLKKKWVRNGYCAQKEGYYS